MKIREITEHKKRYLSLLLLADEEERMIDRYLARGRMFVLEDGEGVKCECVVTDEGDGVLEIKNLAADPAFQRRGYGRRMLAWIEEKAAGQYQILQVGTGDSPLTIPFYEACGFRRSHRIKNFFTDHYAHPIYECGVQLRDMIYLRKVIC